MSRRLNVKQNEEALRKKQAEDKHQLQRSRDRDARLKRIYGLEFAEYERMYVNQSGKCKICGNIEDVLHVDHSHSTGMVRGLLCQGCNTGIGMLKEDVENLKKAIVYLGGTVESYRID